MVKNPPAIQEIEGSLSGSGRSPGGENVNWVPYSCLRNPEDRGAWWATVHGVAKEFGHDGVTRQEQCAERRVVHAPKSLKVPQRLWQSIFKSQVRGVGSAGSVISCCTVLRWADGEGAGWCHRDEHYRSLGSRRPGVVCSRSSSS